MQGESVHQIAIAASSTRAVYDCKMWHVSLLPAPAFPHQGYVRLLLWALLLW